MIPTRVQEAMRRLAAAVKYAHYRNKPEILAEHLADADIVEKWIEAQPETPQPSWDDAPEWAQWWCVGPDGRETWTETEPRITLSRDSWYWGYRYEWTPIECHIPLSIDWRTLKQCRPETE